MIKSSESSRAVWVTATAAESDMCDAATADRHLYRSSEKKINTTKNERLILAVIK